ncbi:DNA-binding response regulator [hydrothermal vent metagenome]|uniref:DNA-binding response regulator n=1 Tax=hydrothermal vent metagenome TaxID=652676 RepID=A0A1W1BGS9_9ZZZZ
MKKINILIVEDEKAIIEELRAYIDHWGYTVINSCINREKILALIKEENINVIIMDICIEGCKQGLETAAMIKKKYPNIEIIFLCDHLDDYNINKAIEIDPVAYIAKPINREEQRISLKIAINRITKENKNKKTNPNYFILDEEFCYDTDSAILFYDHIPMHLTKKENKLLELLIKHRNSIVSISTIKNYIWADQEINDNAIRSLVKRLRQKLKYKFIETFSTRGYKISPYQLK